MESKQEQPKKVVREEAPFDEIEEDQQAVGPIAADASVAAALHAAQVEAEALNAAAAVAVAASGDGPTNRDVKFHDETHPATMLLMDLILLHKVLQPPPEEEKAKDDHIQELSAKLTTLLLEGKQYELYGLKDVPRPFLMGNGRFFAKEAEEWTQLEEAAAQQKVAALIQSRFEVLDKQGEATMENEVLDSFRERFLNKEETEETSPTEGETSNEDPAAANGVSPNSAPRPYDILFLPSNLSPEDSLPHDRQTGNKDLLYIASQQVVADTKEAAMRVQIALKLLTSKIVSQIGDAEETYKMPRYILQQVAENQNAWKELEAMEMAEFATIFVFEVYLEKQIHDIPVTVPTNSSNSLEPSQVPLEQPTVHDVLFGRGGMTNGHPGNRRFRDIIALHRPDYIRATKMDKPKVARRIVRAIRLGNPSGRFLKKASDGKWYDVGDRTAAEKTSQGLRERSNAEKRQRSALREALRVQGSDGEDATDGSSSKKPKLGENGSEIQLPLQVKEKKPKAVARKSLGEGGKGTQEDLPPNAVDKDGNILVTDHDILCGRGGLTNHHKGNKRFRDIVTLHRPDYVRAAKIQKPSVARVIVRAIRNGDPPGRFLKKDKKTGLWYDIGDKRAAEKTSQALREKTKEEQAKAPGLSPFVNHAAIAEVAGSTPVLANVPAGGEETAKAAEGNAATAEAAAPAATERTPEVAAEVAQKVERESEATPEESGNGALMVEI